MSKRDDILSDDEIDTVILSLLDGQGEKGATDDEMREAVRWARRARIANVMLNLVLRGQAGLLLDERGDIRVFAKEPVSAFSDGRG
jgi:hypothetical protein